ncbi:hypothetical protein BIT28_03370 [Photobacterium proteolyticum]|uniref:Uncharacterized protein n=1 Tax=Photobacterium proteolyticum TaxID=1903952 RepID=A0A1Q9GA50_9GAMM|nr:hypothetical protein [Photobacterium proteolyticum]OLQ71219.1 hypothetical protein BIT28_03370 [Photobacterium proteolyticum]
MKAQAQVIRIDNRFFYAFGKAERVLTAWSLGGGKLFFNSSAAEKITKQLEAKGKNPELLNVTLEVEV